MSLPFDAVLSDIEGTTTPISFVHTTLFPYARARMAEFLDRQAASPEVAAALAEMRALAPGQPALATLLGWMDRDAKIGPLKTLQGLIWRDAYLGGAVTGALYPDVAPALRAWHAAGVKLAIYSSGSVAAQRLLFGHSVAGDLTPLFADWFDTAIGPKQAAASYTAIAARLAVTPGRILFLSDVAGELDAAAQAGLATCQLLRAEDGTKPAPGHPQAADFSAIAHR